MLYQTLRPGPPLDEAVELLWLYDGYRPPHHFERVLPSGTVEIIINLMDGELRCYEPGPRRPNRLRSPIVTGVFRRPFIIDTRQQYSIMGVALRPGGAWRLLGLPACDLANTHVEMQTLLGNDARRLMEILWETPRPTDRLRRVEQALRKRQLRDAHQAVEWAAEQVCRYPESARVAALADEAGLSTRRFNELFTREVGISPKGFIRIRRFQSALARLQRQSRADWCALAAAGGYSDQAHLIRDFKEFTGMTPGDYFALPGHHWKQVPVGERDQICPMVLQESGMVLGESGGSDFFNTNGHLPGSVESMKSEPAKTGPQKPIASAAQARTERSGPTWNKGLA